MTEKPKSATRLLTECASIAGFKSADGWPEELEQSQLTRLLAGTKNHKSEAFGTWSQMVGDAIKAGSLEARIVERPTPALPRGVRQNGIASREWAAEFQSPRQALAKSLLRRAYVNRSACVKWLQAIKENPEGLSDCARMWFGEALQGFGGEIPRPQTITEAKSGGSLLLKSRALVLLCQDGNEWPDTLNADELARLWYPDDEPSQARSCFDESH